MKKKNVGILGIWMLTGMLFTGCGSVADSKSQSKEESVSVQESQETAASMEECAEDTTPPKTADSQEEAGVMLEDGVYLADFDTDSSMFQVNEALDGKGTLTVKNGEMTIHISLKSKKILNLYEGLASDAKKEDAQLLEPTVDKVTYQDGLTDEVYGFDVKVPALDQEFDLALIGTKGKWYDHKVKVCNPQPLEENAKEENIEKESATEEEQSAKGAGITAAELSELDNGTYEAEVILEGGSGRASITSPAVLTLKEGEAVLTVEWSSPNYDYMLVEGEKYLPTANEEGNSVFVIPVAALDTPLEVIADTVAMSKPHEIEYTITIKGDTLQALE